MSEQRHSMYGCIIHSGTLHPNGVEFGRGCFIKFEPCEIYNLRIMRAEKPRFGNWGKRLALWLLRGEARQ